MSCKLKKNTWGSKSPLFLSKIPGGGHLYFRLDIIRVKGLSKHTLNTYFSCMKIDPKYVFLHVFFLICMSCPFQNLLIWPKTHPFFSNFARFCTPKRCTRVHCLVLKNNPNYVNFFTRMISNFKYKCPPPGQRLCDDYQCLTLAILVTSVIYLAWGYIGWGSPSGYLKNLFLSFRFFSSFSFLFFFCFVSFLFFIFFFPALSEPL